MALPGLQLSSPPVRNDVRVNLVIDVTGVNTGARRGHHVVAVVVAREQRSYCRSSIRGSRNIAVLASSTARALVLHERQRAQEKDTPGW